MLSSKGENLGPFTSEYRKKGTMAGEALLVHTTPKAHYHQQLTDRSASAVSSLRTNLLLATVYELSTHASLNDFLNSDLASRRFILFLLLLRR